MKLSHVEAAERFGIKVSLVSRLVTDVAKGSKEIKKTRRREKKREQKRQAIDSSVRKTLAERKSIWKAS